MRKDVFLQTFWSISPKESFKILESGEGGLSVKEARERRKQYGANELAARKKTVASGILFRQFKSPLIFILILAGGVTVFLRDIADSVIIFLAVVINTALGFYQEYRAEEALEHLKSYIRERTRAMRDGTEREIDVRDIVPGDIVHIVSGSRVPADARLLSVNALQVDESILTGESLPVEKHAELLSPSTELADRKNMLFGGTLAVSGSGVAIVCKTGVETEIGRISQLVAETSRKDTPLQKNIKRLAWGITVIIGSLTALIFILGIFRGESIISMFLISVAIAVGAIPEALPVAMTMILAIGVERLAKRKAVVRKLVAAESLGSTTVILTDKTGTLTEAHMKLIDVIPTAELSTYHREYPLVITKMSYAQKQVLIAALMNVDVIIENPHEKPSSWRLIGSPLECNVVRVAAEHGLVLADIRAQSNSSVVYPFNSKDKFSVSSVHGVSRELSVVDSHDMDFLSFLGAPDILLEKSNISKDEFVHLSSELHALAKEGKRLLGVAIKTIGKKGARNINFDEVGGLIFLGIIVFYDPVRTEVPLAMARVKEFGVRTVMVTGDLKGTALAVGREIGWDVTEANIIDGASLRGMNDEELRGALDSVRIFARVSPEDKVRIAQAYKDAGEIVAMTGDGINDAPSLKAADVGVAVGSGTDVAKDIADLVLLDNNFKTIASAIEEGRKILSNIRKATIYLLSGALNEILLIGGSIVFGLALPLTAFQILWVNFFSDSFPALAFAFERSTEQTIISKKNRGLVLDAESKFLVLIVGTLTSVSLFLLYVILLTFGFEPALVRSFIFAGFGTYTLFLVFPLRNLKESIFSYPLFTNRLMVFGVIFGIVLMASAIYVPFLQKALGTVPLPPIWVLGVFGFVFVSVAAVEATKWLFRIKKPST